MNLVIEFAVAAELEIEEAQNVAVEDDFAAARINVAAGKLNAAEGGFVAEKESVVDRLKIKFLPCYYLNVNFEYCNTVTSCYNFFT